MNRIVTIACIVHLCALGAFAQSQKLPPDLEGLPAEIKSLKWQSIDPNTLQTLEHCRALLLLNHTLDELSANATAEADLMSMYIEKNNLGSQFANTPLPPAPKQLNYDDAEKVAVALLRGPMNQSYYATELAGLPANTMASYEQLYERTCQRRWSEFDEARHQVRCMSSFLGNNQKLQDYDSWATAEAALRQQQHEKQVEARAAAVQQNDAQVQQLEQQNQQLRQALASAEHQTAQAQHQAGQAQSQAGQAQSQGGQGQQQNNQNSQVPSFFWPGYAGYGGYGGYGYGAYGTTAGAAAGAYAGATAANEDDRRAAGAAAAADAQETALSGGGDPATAGQYHAAGSTWNKQSSYNSAARSQTEQRMNSFHGAPAGRR